MKTKETTIVAFHIGRGGRFNNQGFLSFIGEERIGKFTEDLFTRYENEDHFSDRYGFASTSDDQKCIVDLITDENFEELAEKFGITQEMLGDLCYYDGAGNPTGLTKKDVDSGVGIIDEDGDYDTTYTKHLSDCNDREIEAIKNSDYWNKDEILETLSVSGH